MHAHSILVVAATVIGIGATLVAFNGAHAQSSLPSPLPPLSLTDAQRIAALDAPQINAQAAATRAAREAIIGAGELPDPKLILALDNVPADRSDRYSLTQDFMTMRKIGFSQEFIRGDKLALRGNRAAAEERREAASLVLAKVNLRRDVALAWIDRHVAERQRDLLISLSREAELQVAAAQSTLAGGKEQAADPFIARFMAAQIADRMVENQRLVARANANLRRWIGSAAKRPLGDAPAFDQLAHRPTELVNGLDAHPQLAMYAPMQSMAENDLRLAEATKYPDWNLDVTYGQRGPSYSNMISIGVRIDLPIFQSRRQDPAIASKLAAVEQIRARAEDALRAHAAEVDVMLADWDAAKARLQRYRAELLPLARERADVTLAAYRGGKSDLTPVLDARRNEIETQLNQLMAEGELARAWANLNFLLAGPKDLQ